MIEYKIILVIIAVLINFIAYFYYIRNVLINNTKPHSFSWIIWSILVGIAFFAQLSDNAGIGMWVTGFDALLCFIVFVLSIKKGEKNITNSDKISLILAILAIVIWIFTSNPLLSVILISFIDGIGFFPTFRKSYNKPYEETVTLFFLSGLIFALALFALEHYTIITVLYISVVMSLDFLFTIMIIIRRRKFKKMK